MTQAWHKAQPELVEGLKEDLQTTYPTLHVREHAGRIRVRGTIPVMDEGRELDRYGVELELARDDPRGLPTVWEIGGRIPRTPERHVNPTGTLCVCLPDAYWAANPRGLTVLQFLAGPVRNFLLGNSLVERGEPWPFGEWDHGGKGAEDFYGDLVGTRDATAIHEYLVCLSKPKLKGHWTCPCGSGKRLRDCHLGLVRDLRERVPSRVATKALEQIRR
jgi:hypothetical protein